MPSKFNPTLYFIADPQCCAGRDIATVTLAAAKGGATLIQYRNKSGNMPAIIAEAALLTELLKPYKIPLLINDHINVVQAVGADGVHLGQGDTPPQAARELLGANAIIGQTAFTSEHLKAINPAHVDYIGTGPVFPTFTDKGKPVLGIQNFAKLVALSPVPVVGIGGITAQNANSVITAGAKGTAIMRAIGEAQDPETATRNILNSIIDNHPR